MRQWKTISSSDYIIDNRKREDVLNKIFELAKSYTPEWNPDTQNPDMGAVIALLFSEQMEENIRLWILNARGKMFVSRIFMMF